MSVVRVAHKATAERRVLSGLCSVASRRVASSAAADFDTRCAACALYGYVGPVGLEGRAIFFFIFMASNAICCSPPARRQVTPEYQSRVLICHCVRDTQTGVASRRAAWPA